MSSFKEKGFGKGRSPTRFSFTYADLAEVIGCSPAAARKHAQRGNFDPRSLVSILEFVRDGLSGTMQESSGERPRRRLRRRKDPGTAP